MSAQKKPKSVTRTPNSVRRRVTSGGPSLNAPLESTTSSEMHTTNAQKTGKWWESRATDASHHVDHPAAYYVASALSLLLSGILAWNAFVAEDHFWSNLNMIFTAGALTLAAAASTLLQIRPLRTSAGLPVTGVLLLAGSAWLYQDASNQTVLRLHRYFAFDVSQLAQAIATGTRYLYALEAAACISALGFVAAVAVAYALAFRTTSGTTVRTDWWFRGVSLGMAVAFLLVSIVSWRIFGSVAADAITVHAAYDVDFTDHFNCSLAPQGDKVLFSTMSDNTGYAMHMDLPDRRLLSISKADLDVQSPTLNNLTVVTCNEPPKP
ncbi:hypothetical protein [Paraburkholderia sp. J94]|uniref:hypothetical protein n=1 Tax=Paraburkholderia sp. J94 TaxID=2805441 RepID=UPI002AB1304C|nr:hypothetical protein [Paraburkholderia sp. J94]